MGRGGGGGGETCIGLSQGEKAGVIGYTDLHGGPIGILYFFVSIQVGTFIQET